MPDPIFETLMGHAFDSLMGAEGEAATLYRAAGTPASQEITVIFNEFVGFVDDRRRAVFTLRGADLTGGAVNRSDYFVLDGETDQWSIVDVRDDKAGGIEVRADGALERL
jgi:hypothetical protein